MSKLLRAWLAMLVLAAFALPSSAAVRPPVEHFFSQPAFSGATISPSGKYLAVRVASSDGWQRLAVVDIASNTAKLIAQLEKSNISQFEWINDERIVFDSDDKVAQGDVYLWPGLWAINRDGSNFRQLAHVHWNDVDDKFGLKLQPVNTRLAGVGNQDSDEVYVARYHIKKNYQTDFVELFRLNTLTGHAERMKRPPGAHDWYFDAKGEPRLVWSSDDKGRAWYWRDPAGGKDAEWTKLIDIEIDNYEDSYSPAGIAPDGTIYMAGRGEGEDKTALYRFDVKTRKLAGEPLVRLADFDFRGSLIANESKVLGVSYTADADATAWFDPKLKAVQDKLDQLLPATTNRISVPRRAQTPWVLVISDSDRQPPVYRLYNTETGMLNEVGKHHARINPLEMSKTQFVRYKARDGLEIPAWLTLPHGATAKGLPMVVVVHGGPWVDGRKWEWESEPQFLASRGYAVLEPDFRGTTGYGQKHFKASWKQWGLKMQDDVADGVRWLIAQGIADPKRVCIYGGSYGGYSALMGLVNDPDLYKCAVNIVGVTDINLMYDGHWSQSSDFSALWKKYGMPQMVGDQVKDATQLKATSPVEQAARITQPVLLAYGGADVRVPVYHGRLFHDAVKKTNPNVEWLLYPEEGHGFYLEKNRFDFYKRVEVFLDKHIGK